MGDWLARRARTYPDRPALVTDSATLTYSALDGRACDLAGRVAALGVRPGDRVALLAGTGIPAATAVHALPKIGAVLVPLHARLAPEEIAWQVADCGARALLYGAAHHEAAGRVAREHPGVRRAALGEPLSGDAPIETLDPRPLPPLTPAPDGLHTIVYTSGTTGRPKGARLTRENHRASAAASARWLGHGRDDRWLCCLPLHHVGGLAILLRAVLDGSAVVLQDGFDADRVLAALARERVTHVSLVSLMLRRLFEADPGARADLTALRGVLLGGGPLPEDLIAESLARGVPVAPTYGLTECASQVATLPPGDLGARRGTVGRALPGLALRIVREDGREARCGEAGEIAVAGPVITPGYWERPEESAAALRDGWFHTGDLGRLDPEGFLTVIDRKAEMILSGGENVYPAEVERVLLSHPDVLEAAVYGRPDPRWGETVAAAVVLRPGAPADAAKIVDHCRTGLAGYKLPRELRFVPSLPRSAQGKVLRRALAGEPPHDPPPRTTKA
jgi:O-succinylbenzoic acid--CoA ligase